MPISTIDSKGLTSPLTSGVTTNTVTSAAATALTLQSAGTTAITVDTSQNVGVGLTSPSQKLDVSGSAQLTYAGGNNYLYFQSTNNYIGRSGSTGDVWLNTVGGQHTIFGISGAEKMRVNASGDVLIGTTSYGGSGNAKTRIYKTGNRPNFEVEQGDSGGYNVQSIAYSNGGIYYHCNFQEGNTQRGSITSNGANTAYNTGSDYRLKDDVVPMTGGLNKISALKPVAWKWKSNGSDGQGFLAHELQEVVPECVTGAKDAVDENEKPIYQMVDVSYLIPTLTKAIQELKTIVDAQAAEIAELKAKVA
jgi:hypothetical protein